MTAATDSGRRIVTLDIIRGVAVMGIFSVNITAFAMIEGAYFNPPAYGGADGANLTLWAANMIVIDGKMRSLFSMLFGASMLLVIERAEAAGRSGWLTHFRRMTVLLGFGLLHYFFIWFGDILVLYAVSGVVAYAFRRHSVRSLLILGGCLLLVHMLLFATFLYEQYRVDIAAHAPGATGKAIEQWNDGLGSFFPGSAEIAKDKALHLGPWLGIVEHKLSEWTSLVQGTLVFLADTVGLMLIGMAGYRSGFLTGEWSDARYRQVATWALPIGAAAGAAIVVNDLSSKFYVIRTFGAFVMAATPFLTIMALGYAALIVVLSRRQGWLSRRIAAAGRCAFTNYLGTSLIATFVFYGWGLGLYGSVSRWQAWLLVPIVWLIMLAWSKPWLEQFHYGPFEWAWRSLARGKVQPFRKRVPAEAVAV